LKNQIYKSFWFYENMSAKSSMGTEIYVYPENNASGKVIDGAIHAKYVKLVCPRYPKKSFVKGFQSLNLDYF
jgi:hypothetical protein